MLTREQEDELITRSQAGDVSAFNQLVLSYQQSVYTVAYRLLNHSETASDVTQETFLSAYRHIRSFRGGASLKAWLFRIATNLATDHWRRTQRRPSESLEALLEEEESVNPSLFGLLTSVDVQENPEAALLSQELQTLLQEAIEQLPFEQRVALVLCDVQGLSYEEIAESTRATPGTVRSRISRARARLRDYLYEHRELFPRPYRPNKRAE
jgi:RNA polymerase sigma-70 factor (ECF subfamily)